MATHVYYDTQHTAVTDAEISTATELLWGIDNIVRWKTIRRANINFSNANKMLEISFKNIMFPFIFIDGVLKYKIKAFKASETQQRGAMANAVLPNANAIPLNSFLTIGTTSCIFKLHADLVNTYYQ